MRFKKKVKGKYKVVKNGHFIKLAIFSVIGLAVFGIIGLLCANCCWMTANLASLWGGVLSAAATIILGIVAVWQNIEYKRQSDMMQDKLFKAQVFSSCPYFSIEECDIQTKTDKKFGYMVKLKNIGKTFAPFVMISELEFSKTMLFLGKSSKDIFNKCFDETFLNVKCDDTIEFITEQIDFELIEGQRYFSHIILSVVSDNQVQYDQQITLEFKYENNQLEYIGQAVCKFLELYDI